MGIRKSIDQVVGIKCIILCYYISNYNEPHTHTMK